MDALKSISCVRVFFGVSIFLLAYAMTETGHDGVHQHPKLHTSTLGVNGAFSNTLRRLSLQTDVDTIPFKSRERVSVPIRRLVDALSRDETKSASLKSPSALLTSSCQP